jgi:carboxyl-terminal processing protease
MKKLTIVLVMAVTAISSCQKLLLPSVSKNTPVNNFEEMWKGYDQWYGMFETRHINWDSLHQVFSTQVTDNMSNRQLYDMLSRLITPLNDIHAFLQPTSDGLPRYESSEFFRTNKIQQDFSIDLVKQKYIPSLVAIDEKFHYGIIPVNSENIGYIHFGEFGMPVSFYQLQMKKVMDALKDTKGIIVDIRNHAGGDDEVSRFITGWFAAETKLFMTVRKRNGPARNNFTAPQNWYVDKQGSYQYTKPVVLLTTRWTASAGETFTWAMNTQTHITQMGDTTAGGFSDVISRELPNGWLYFVGVGDYRNAKGISEEGKGVAPKIHITNTKLDIDAGKDKVLEAAIEKLK